MHSAWKKLVNMWSNHKKASIALIFGSIVIIIMTAQIAPVNALTSNPNNELTNSTDYIGAILVGAANVLEAIFQMAWGLVVALIQVLIWIVQYDGFSNNTAINIGWPIVRNAINMFVIVGLLAIAIKNLIPGQGNVAQTQSQLFRMLLAVVLMNFSKTITLLAVDASNVVTLTFAQAVTEIGAGNFIQLFGLQDNVTMSNDALGSIQAGFQQGVTLIGGALFKLVMVGAVGIAIAIMVIAFVVRIVMLWFLVILSPAAFFAFGMAKGAGKDGALGGGMLGSVWKQWSGQLMGLLAFGPVLVFFLWLSLSIAAAGELASTVGFEVDANAPAPTFLESAQPANLLGTIIAIIMIYLGIGQAASVAASAQGVGDIMKKGSDITQGFIKRYSKKAAIGTAAGGLAGFGAGAIGVGASMASAAGMSGLGGAAGATALGGLQAAGALGTLYGANKVVNAAPGAAKSAVRKIDSVAGSLQGSRVGGILNTIGLSELREGTSAAAKALGGIEDGRRREADAWVKNRDSNSIMKDLENAQGVINAPMSSAQEIERARAVMQKFVTDKDFAKQYESERGEDAARKIAEQAIAQIEKDGFDHIEDEKEKAQAKKGFLEFKAKRLDLLTDEQMEKTVSDSDFSVKMLSEKALESSAVRNKLASKIGQTRYDSEGKAINKSMLEVIEEGGAGQKLQEFAKNDYGGIDRILDKDGKVQIERVRGDEQIAKGVQGGKIKIQNLTEDVIEKYKTGLIDGIESMGNSRELEKVPGALSEKVSEKIGERITSMDKEIERQQALAQQARVQARAATDKKDKEKFEKVEQEAKKKQAEAERRKEKLRMAQTRVTQSSKNYISESGEYNSNEDRKRMQALVDQDYTAARYVTSAQISSGEPQVSGDLVTSFVSNIESIKRDVNAVISQKDKATKEAAKRQMEEILKRYKEALERGVDRTGGKIDEKRKTDYEKEIKNLQSMLAGTMRERVQQAASEKMKDFIREE